MGPAGPRKHKGASELSFTTVLGKMMTILVVIGLGAMANRLGWLGQGIDQKLSKLILSLTAPALILGSVLEAEDVGDFHTLLSLLEVGAIFYLLAIAVALVAAKLLGGTPAQQGAWRYGLSFSNVGFIGYPVAIALYGPGALFYAAMLALPLNLLSYTLGPLMLVGKGRFSWKQLFSPCTVAAVLALLCALTGVKGPAIVGETLSFLGSVTTPLSLLVVGSLLMDLPMGQGLRSPRVWVLAVLRLLVMPALLVPILRPLGLDPVVFGVAVSQMAMPTAVNGILLSLEYGGDTEALAQSTLLTTILSTFTIPLIAAIFL